MRYAAMARTSADLLRGPRSKQTTILGATPRYSYPGSLLTAPVTATPARTSASSHLSVSHSPIPTERLAG